MKVVYAYRARTWLRSISEVEAVLNALPLDDKWRNDCAVARVIGRLAAMRESIAEAFLADAEAEPIGRPAEARDATASVNLERVAP